LAESPFGLFLRSRRSTPLFAVLSVLGILGGCAIWLVNRRQWSDDRIGLPPLFGLALFGGVLLAGVGVAVAYYT